MQTESTLTATDTGYALGRIGLDAPDGRTLIVRAEGVIHAPLAEVWNYVTDLERWKDWQAPLVLSARWTKGGAFAAGNQFEQLLQLGFPAGRTISRETLGEVIPGERIAWWKSENGLASCHVWTIRALTAGTTLATNTEVFHGAMIPWLRPLVGRRWQRLFERSLEGLAACFPDEHYRIDEEAPVKAHAWRRIPADPDRVWAVLTDFENWPAWQPGVSSAKLEGGLVPGGVFRWKANGMNITSRLSLVRPSRYVSWQGRAAWVRAVHAWKLEPDGAGGTVVYTRESMRGALVGRLFSAKKLSETLERGLMALEERVTA